MITFVKCICLIMDTYNDCVFYNIKLIRKHIIYFKRSVMFNIFQPVSTLSCKEYRNALEELSKATLRNSAEEGLPTNR